MSNFQIMLLPAALLLSPYSYACVLVFKLKDRQNKRSQPVEFEPKSQSQLDAQQSVRVIAQALLQNDLTPTEAAMRIGFLAQQFRPSNSIYSQYSLFETSYGYLSLANFRGLEGAVIDR